MAIKLCKALEMSLDQFKNNHINSVSKLRDGFSKNPNFSYKPKLPKPEVIYQKEFHFLDETLLQRQERKAAKKKRKKEERKTEAESPAEKKEVETDGLIFSEEKDKNQFFTMANQA
jgi:hypothetical protein